MPQSYFEQRERALLGERFGACYAAANTVYRGVTVNLLRTTPQQFAAKPPFAVAPSPFCANAFLFADETLRPGRTPWHHAGVFYVQEPSATVPATLLQVQPGHKVLDVCAAPGGKTSQLAGALQGQGILVANEYVSARATVLKNNLERMGVRNALVTNSDTAALAKAFPSFFDRVLVDAPCSGEGMFRKESQAVAQHSEALVRQCAALGSDILDNAAACLASGGLMVYSTCTFAPEEDEAQIGAFLQRHPEFTLLPTGLQIGSEGEKNRANGYHYAVEHTRRIYPCHGGEGHFMALLQKAGISQADTPQKPQKAKQNALCEAFLRTYFPSVQGAMLQTGDTIQLLPPQMPLPKKLRIVQAGVTAGTLVKNRFEPAHHLFMAYGAQCKNQEFLTANDSRTAAWLRGEQIEAQTAQNGYTAVLCDGFPLGFGKVSGGVVKNHYPKGLRNLK